MFPPCGVVILFSMKILDISTRISREGNREADRLYSDVNQEEAAREFISNKSAAVGIVTREKNVSGGKAAKDRELEKLIQRVERGESHGIVVYDWSRFSREDPWPAVMLVGRVHNAGGVVYGVTDNYDSSAPMAAAITAIYAEQASNYLKVARERSAAGQRKARERGAYVAKTPNCYERGEKGELVKSKLSKLPQKIFERKLAGDSYADLQRLAEKHGLKCTVGAIRKMLSNPVYIGESPCGPSPALVDRETFMRVQDMTHKRKPTGKGAETLSQGLVKCANCGSTLVVYQTGIYYCRGLKLGGCEKRGSVSIKNLDAYVEQAFLASIQGDGPLARAYADDKALEETREARNVAAFELEEIKASTALISTLGIKAFEEMVSGAVAKLEIADAAYEAAQSNASAYDGLASLVEHWLNGKIALRDRRELLAEHVERIEVGTGRVPVERKCRVIFRAGVLGSPDDAGARLVAVQDLGPLALKR